MDLFGKEEYEYLKNNILTVGGYVEKALEEVTLALINRDPKHLDSIDSIERQINLAHIQIDKQCLDLLARLSPFATDLRRILASIKINSDLERMGDLSINIARNVKNYLTRKEIALDKNALTLITEVKWMVKNVLDSFGSENIKKAEEVLKRDDFVDQCRHKMNDSIREIMKQGKEFVDSGIDMIFIAKNLERMGDHATNIAEDVIFILSGDDIRHGGLANEKK